VREQKSASTAATGFSFQGQRSQFIYANFYLTYKTNTNMYKMLSYRRDSARQRSLRRSRSM